MRHYTRKTTTSYSKDAIQAAVKEIREKKMTRSAASKKYGVPATTLFNHLSGKSSRIGAGSPTILSHAEERELVTKLQVLQGIGFGMTKDLVGVVICDYLKDQPARPNPFTLGIPGHDWWRLFMKRWSSELSIRKPQHLPTSRATAMTIETINSWFDKLESVLKEIGLADLPQDVLEQHIWNCDETGFCTAQASKKVIAKRGERDVHDTIYGWQWKRILHCACSWMCKWCPTSTVFCVQRKKPLE